MDRCSRCGANTQLYVNGTPICPACSDKLEREMERPATNQGQHPVPSGRSH